MANINPNKLVRDFEVNTSTEGELRLYWEIPRNLAEDEEIVVARRKDAFPVEIRNRNFEDRYTDVAQVELFRGSPLHCTHLIPNGEGVLLVAGDNSFSRSLIPVELERDNKYTGRLIRDSRSQVFRITGNTEDEIYYENISKNPDNQVIPVEGEFVIMVDFPKQRRALQTIELLQNAYTLTVDINSFTAGDTVTINNSTDLVYGTDWTGGATVNETATNLSNAIKASGLKYVASVYDNTILIEKGAENTLAVTSTTGNVSIVDYAASPGKIFVDANLLSQSELRHLVIQDGDLGFSFVKSNSGKLIQLYTDTLVPNTFVSALDSHNNTFPCGFIDTYRSASEALKKRGSGLETDVFYYYTAFTTPITSVSVTYNEEDLYGENPLPYTIDKVAPYFVRVFYESIQYCNADIGTYTYDAVTGEITFDDGRDLSGEDILVGDLFADNLGNRFAITDISGLASGIITVATGLSVGLDPQSKIHGSVTRAEVPVGFNNIAVGDTFKDIAGNSFTIFGTSSDPLQGVSVPPSHSFDIEQGLIDENIMLNPFLVPYSYDPADGKIQYGERIITQNTQLSPFTYDSLTGKVIYTTNINLNDVEPNQLFRDGSGTSFEIIAVNADMLTITLETGLTVDTTVNTRRDGSVYVSEGFKDIDGTSLLSIDSVAKLDLFKTNSKADYVVKDVDAVNGAIYIEPDLDALSLIVETEFDGSVYRRGAEVAWVGFMNENEALLAGSNLGAVRRYNSVNFVQFAYVNNALSTQSFAISAKDNEITRLLFDWWPSVFKDLDSSGDLEDLMGTFGYKFNEIYSLITAYELQNADLVVPEYLTNGYRQSGLGELSQSLGIDTRRRVMKDLVSAWKLKGNRDGINKFIKIITTWDVTNGTGDVIRAIQDTTPDISGLRHYSPSLGETNTKIVDTTDVQVPPAGRFVKGIPGLNLSGFFNQVEIQIELPNVAMFVGNSTNLSTNGGSSIIQDSTAEFGQINGLKGCFIIPVEGNPNDYYEIIANTDTTVTVAGSVPVNIIGNKYVIISPLNLNRFVALQNTIAEQLPYNAVPVFTFTVKTI